jgi:hypothetical protein
VGSGRPGTPQCSVANSRRVIRSRENVFFSRNHSTLLDNTRSCSYSTRPLVCITASMAQLLGTRAAQRPFWSPWQRRRLEMMILGGGGGLKVRIQSKCPGHVSKNLLARHGERDMYIQKRTSVPVAVWSTTPSISLPEAHVGITRN